MILDEIIKKRKIRLCQEKEEDRYGVYEYMEGRREFPRKSRSLKNAIEESKGIAIIAEVKKASPSKGLICENFNPVEIAMEYEKIGAACISVLTEEDFFQGSKEYLREIRENTSLPILRKDFIFEEYQIYEARALGADGILLICRLFELEQLRVLKKAADKAGLEVLFEVHNEQDIQLALAVEAELIGINNRDLANFTVDLKRTESLIAFIPAGVTVISESGIVERADVEKLKKWGAKGALVGETLMKSVDKSKKMKELTLYTEKNPMLKVKLCGVKTIEDVEGVNNAAPDYCGFVLAKSPRGVPIEELEALTKALDRRIIPVGVFVNPTHIDINKAVDRGIKVIQLHGDEDQGFIDEIKKKFNRPEGGKIEIWKALRLGGDGNFGELPTGIDGVVLDKYSKEAYGGTGEQISKKNLIEGMRRLSRREDLKIILAGGLTEDNLEEMLTIISVDGVDTSSGIETEGKKDWLKMKGFVKKAKELRSR